MSIPPEEEKKERRTEKFMASIVRQNTSPGLLTKILGYAPKLLERVTSTGRTLHVHIATLVQTQKSIGRHGELGHLLAQLHNAEQQFSASRRAQAATSSDAPAAASSSAQAADGGLPSSSPLQFTAHASAENAHGAHRHPPLLRRRHCCHLHRLCMVAHQAGILRHSNLLRKRICSAMHLMARR